MKKILSAFMLVYLHSAPGSSQLTFRGRDKKSIEFNDSIQGKPGFNC
jgi:hypothetical protein